MQTMNPTWPAPAADQPPAPVPARATMSRGAKIFLGFLATILTFGIIGALGETTQDKTRAYSSGSTTAVDSPSESTTADNSSSLADWAQTYGVPDAQTIARKILSCVYRVNESFGIAHVSAPHGDVPIARS